MINQKRIEDIVLKDIEELISQEYVEDKFLEYKGEMDKGEKDRILNAVCGFSNADGGLFIYGLKEEKGVPAEIDGISLGDKSWDDKKRGILSSIENSIEPKVYVEIDNIELENGKILIVIKIPKSWSAPHCIKRNNGKNRSFYIRRDGSTNPMTYQEIETMFNSKNTTMDKINEFRNERLRKFSSKNAHNFKVLYHFIPLDSFSKEDININEARDKLQNKDNIGGIYRYNFEGIYHPYDVSFKQLFRNSIFEMVYESEAENEPISLEHHQQEFIEVTKEIYDLYHELNIFCPIMIFISITNIINHPIFQNGIPKRFKEPFDKERDILNPNGILIENKEDIESSVHNLFIPIWNHYEYQVDYK